MSVIAQIMLLTIDIA